MGIFDDAIREHLELKRHAGVDEEELKELEDEAFGPPARPGDPDFPGSTSEEEAVEPEESVTSEAEMAPSPSPGVFDAETAEARTPEDAVIDAPPEEEPALTPLDESFAPETDEAPIAPVTDEAPAVSETEEVPAAPASETEEAPAAPASEEMDAVPEEPAEDAAPDPADGSTFTTAEREAIADQPTVFFEQQPPGEIELGDLELDLDEEIEEVGGSVSEPLPDDEPLIVEEAFAEPMSEAEVAEPPHEVEPEPEPASEPESDLEPEPGLEPEPDGETVDEDVLEETPEFLRDNPDDDELWFEQGEPKDFDF